MKFSLTSPKKDSNDLARHEAPKPFQQFTKGLEAVKRRLAEKLQSSTNGYSKRKKIFILAFLIIVLSSYNIWLISRSFFAPRASQGNLKSILQPFKVPSTKKIIDVEKVGISKENFEQLMSYKNHLDSLAKIGDPRYMKIMSNRPGLLDSLNLLKDLYQMQK